MAVTSTNNLRRGSKGDDVSELQKLLNQNGYNLAVDGSYGPLTEGAVIDYQKKNGLKVDGIVGTGTWGFLTGAKPTQNAATMGASPSPTPTESKAPTFSYEAYAPSDNVKQAEALLQQQLANKPGEYTSPWQSQLNDIVNQILNREKFSYDLNGDALYQQYKDQYTTQGKMAMMDTMGQAQAMTGGYGNSYAQSVGQQAYQGYLQQLNDKVPELYQLALNQYNREGDDMYNQASIMAGMEEQEYGRYRDQMSDYYTELDRLTSDARYQAEQDYGQWMDKTNLDYTIHGDAVDEYWKNKELEYQTERDRISDEQWQKEFDLAKDKVDTGDTGDNPDEPDDEPKPGPEPTESYYDQLLGAVSTLKNTYRGKDWQTQRKSYEEASAAINDAYKQGKITAEQKTELLKLAMPLGR